MKHILLQDKCVVEDNWLVFSTPEDEIAEAILAESPSIYPLKVWQQRRADILNSKIPFGLLLAADEDPADIAADVDLCALIAVDFPKFSDGRGYSIGRLLRERYHFRGELRAVGDVLVDQLFYMHRVGFDAFCLRADQSVEAALKALATFSDSYQTAVDQPEPAFRRRLA